MNRVFMGASVLIRMGVSLVVLVLLARLLGPRDYGLVATVFAGATLASLLTDFGLATKTLRDVAADPSTAHETLNGNLSVKIYLTTAVIIMGGVAAAFMPGSTDIRVAAALLGAAVLIGTVGELALTPFRAVGRFAAETWITGWTSLAHLLFVAITAVAAPSVLPVAIAFLTSRLLFAIIAVRSSTGLFPFRRLALSPIRNALLVMRNNVGWALDNGLSYINGQIDGMLVAFVFGLPAAGVYQAAARFAQAQLAMIAIFANVHIPRLSSSQDRAAGRMSRQELRMLIEIVLAGLLLAIALVFSGPLITRFLLGAAYRAADQLWLGLAVFVAIRYVASAGGVRLTARGDVKIRVWGQFAGLACFSGLSLLLLPRSGYVAIPWIAAASSTAVAIVYFSDLLLHTKSNTSPG